MKITNITVMNIYDAAINIRLPFDKVHKSDSIYQATCMLFGQNELDISIKAYNYALIGDTDRKLITTLIKRASSHRKFLRQIFVGMTIDAPFSFWKQLDTYCIGVVKTSKSTMHTLLNKELIQDDFETPIDNLDKLNLLIKKCKETKGTAGYIEIFKELTDKLPSGYIQRRYYTTNYEVLRKIYEERQGHKLPYWDYFLSVLEKLPYFDIMIKG